MHLEGADDGSTGPKTGRLRQRAVSYGPGSTLLTGKRKPDRKSSVGSQISRNDLIQEEDQQQATKEAAAAKATVAEKRKKRRSWGARLFGKSS
jgi:hypothetical protein